MWVYYAIVTVLYVIIMVKVVEAIVTVIRRQRDAVRKEDWLDLFIETIIKN